MRGMCYALACARRTRRGGLEGGRARRVVQRGILAYCKLTSLSSAEIISISVGQAGVQIGNA